MIAMTSALLYTPDSADHVVKCHVVNPINQKYKALNTLFLNSGYRQRLCAETTTDTCCYICTHEITVDVNRAASLFDSGFCVSHWCPKIHGYLYLSR